MYTKLFRKSLQKKQSLDNIKELNESASPLNLNILNKNYEIPMAIIQINHAHTFKNVIHTVHNYKNST